MTGCPKTAVYTLNWLISQDLLSPWGWMPHQFQYCAEGLEDSWGLTCLQPMLADWENRVMMSAEDGHTGQMSRVHSPVRDEDKQAENQRLFPGASLCLGCCQKVLLFRSERIFLLGHPSGNTLIGKSSGMTLIGKTNHHTNNLRKPYRKKNSQVDFSN